MKRHFTYLLLLVMCPLMGWAQINTDRVMAIGRNALYFEDYVLSIQYFNQVINAKPYLADPYFFRGLAKINLDDYPGDYASCGALWHPRAASHSIPRIFDAGAGNDLV